MRTLARQEGYLLIDNRMSPGTAQVPEGKILEAATATCSHCQRIVILNPDRTRERGYCRKCDHYVCDTCVGGECRPFAQVLDEAEARILRGLPAGGLTCV